MNKDKFIEFYDFLKEKKIKIKIKNKKYDCYEDFLSFDEIYTIYLSKEKLMGLTDKDIDSIMDSKYPKEALVERTRDFFKELSEEKQEELMSYINNSCCEIVASKVVEATNIHTIDEQERKNICASIVSHAVGKLQAACVIQLAANASLAKRDDFVSLLEFVAKSEKKNVYSITDILSNEICQKRSDLYDILHFMNHFKSDLEDDFQVRNQLKILFSDPDFVKEKNTLHYAKILSQSDSDDNAENLNEILMHIKNTHPELLSRKYFSSLATDVSHAKYGVALEVFFFLDNFEKEDSLKEEEIEMARWIAKAKGEEEAELCREMLWIQCDEEEKEDLKQLAKDISNTKIEPAKLAYHFVERAKKGQNRFAIGKMICNFSNKKVATLKDDIHVDHLQYLLDYFSYENQVLILLYLNSLTTKEELQQFRMVLVKYVDELLQKMEERDFQFSIYRDKFPLIKKKLVFPPLSSDHSFWDLFSENQETAIELLKEDEESNIDLDQNQKVYRKKR